MYTFLNSSVPRAMKKIFQFNEALHYYPTRNKLKFKIPLYKYQIGMRFVKKTGTDIWHSSKLTNECTIGYFKQQVKASILESYQNLLLFHEQQAKVFFPS